MPGISAAEKDEVDQHIAECQQHARPEASAPVALTGPGPAASPAPAVAAPALPPAAPPPPTSDASLVSAAPKPEVAASRPVYTKWWFWTAAGALVLAGVGTALALSQSGGNGTTIPSTPLGNQPLF